jgi:hypothetical protein
MVMEELAKVPEEPRRGPLIVNPRTGLPYRNWYYGNLWRKVRKLTVISKEVWNRDARAGGVTEAGGGPDRRSRQDRRPQQQANDGRPMTGIALRRHAGRRARVAYRGRKRE